MTKKNSLFQQAFVFLRPGALTVHTSFLHNFILWCKKRKLQLCFSLEDEERLQKTLPKNIFKHLTFLPSLQEYLNDCQLIFSLGGDGTLLGVCSLLKEMKKNIPIFSLNLGHLGFLTEFQKSEFYDGLEEVLRGKMELISLPLSSVEIFQGKKIIASDYFLNDAVVAKYHISRLFELSVECGDESVFNISGDGLIISSPLGSTAYSLAAGGPIVHPEVKAMVLTPICPHSLKHRPIVLPSQTMVKLRPLSRVAHLVLTVDGQKAYTLEGGEQIIINGKKKREIKLIKNPNKAYFQTLKEKFYQS